MGKVTGFIDYPRQDNEYESPQKRLQHYAEFVPALSQAKISQQSARCMDCGIPFCNNACPINNIIPDWNDLVYREDYQAALEVLHSTNNFPEFTARVCPAPCETACTLGINNLPVGIKSIEHFIIEYGWKNQWVLPQPPHQTTGKNIAIVGSGPAGLTAAQQLARAGHTVTIFEKNNRIGGLLRYGIPDFKLEKHHIDQRIEQMKAEGVIFKTSIFIGESLPAHIQNDAIQTLSPDVLIQHYDAIILAGGAELPRDLDITGRSLNGVHFAMDFLPQQNKINAGDQLKTTINAKNKHVVVIGGGDTGSDCVGTANRQGAASVLQIELMPKPPESEDKSLVWPYWPMKLRTSSSHEEGCQRDWSIITKRFEGKRRQLNKIIAARAQWNNGVLTEIPDSEFEISADLVFLAMGFMSPVTDILNSFGVETDAKGNARAPTNHSYPYQTSVPKVFAAGDMRRGQSLVVWAIREGRQCAQAVDAFLMHNSQAQQ